MIDCSKIYRMVLTDDDGKTYKSDFVKIYNTKLHRLDWTKEVVLNMEIESHELVIGELDAGTPPEMPTAAVARKATKIIQEERRDKEIAEEWKKLTKEICEAIKDGKEEITVKTIYIANKERLMKMGYEVNRDSCNYVFRIRWVESEFKF